MNPGPEIPNRDIQREVILQQIQNPMSRETVRSNIPDNERVDYTSDSFGKPDYRRNFANLVRTEGGNAYKYIFAMATTASNPNGLANALGSLAAIDSYFFVHSNPQDDYINEKAQYDFLVSSDRTPFASDGARALQGEMVSIWNEWGTKDPNMALGLVNHLTEYSLTPQQRQAAKHWAEAYLLTILDPYTPFELRKALISSPMKLGLGRPSYGAGGDYRFNSEISFWNTVNGSWVYPEMFGKGGASGGDLKDWEIAGLRQKVSQLEQQGKRGETGMPSSEQQRLKEMAANALKIVMESEEKMKVYKEIGGHPLDILGIGYATWKNASPEERKKTALSKFRQFAMKYHPDMQNASSDPLIKELIDQQMTRVSKAFKYLEGNSNKDQF